MKAIHCYNGREYHSSIGHWFSNSMLVFVCEVCSFLCLFPIFTFSFLVCQILQNAYFSLFKIRCLFFWGGIAGPGKCKRGCGCGCLDFDLQKSGLSYWHARLFAHSDRRRSLQ